MSQDVFILVKKNRLQRQILCLWLIILLSTHNLFDLLAVQGTLKSLLQHHSSNASILNSKGNQSWIFIARAEKWNSNIWPPDANNWLIWKNPDPGKDWRWKEKGTTEDETVGWHHWLNGHEFEQNLGVGDEQGGLACCSPWHHKESETAEQQNWNELNSLPQSTTEQVRRNKWPPFPPCVRA